MFDASVYLNRRKQLMRTVGDGIILLLGNGEMPMNYRDNVYPFRQDSTFLYYIGLDQPQLAAILDAGSERTILFGNEVDIEDVIWMGPQESMKQKADRSGVEEVRPFDALGKFVSDAVSAGKTVHYFMPYRLEQQLLLAELLNRPLNALEQGVSVKLIKAIVAQRSVKDDLEIEQIELAHDITREMHLQAMKMARPGVLEQTIAGTIEGIALSRGSGVSFPVILSVHGEILHNHGHGNVLREGQLLVNDSGAEANSHYAADITRTMPVGGKFSTRQKEIYQIVLNAQMATIDMLKPQLPYKEAHLQAAKVIAQGLKELGLMRGDVEEAVAAGAHALFFPHGLGHMMGLDVHDMENLGEDYVGYDDTVQRSDQFGLAYLRLAKKLQTGFVLTVEPGIYFIPALIEKWRAEKKFDSFLDYGKIASYIGFGGIRIEDDVVITESGCRVLGKPIPKAVDEVEQVCSA